MSQARRALVALISVIAVLLGFAPTAFAQSVVKAAAPGAAPSSSASAVNAQANTPGPGYWLASSGGDVFSNGAADFHGSTGAITLTRPIVGIAATPTGNGYWMVASDGGIFSFGDAAFHGSTGAIALNQPIVGMASTPSGHGYWLVASDGGIFSFGDAAFHGSTGAMTLNKPIVGMTSTPSGNGYLLVASDGGIFAFGDAAFHGSTGNITLNQPITGIASTPTGHGYWMVASDGGIFAFGDAHFYGSTGNIALNMPIVGMAASPTGKGYWFVAADGGIFSFGDAHFYGSANAQATTQTIIGMAASAPLALPALPPATKLDLTSDPSDSTGGVDFATQPVVHVLDADGNTVTNSTVAVTLSITNPPNGVALSCNNNTVHAVNGVARFGGCSINTTGTYSLRVSSASLTSALTSVTITLGPAAQVGFVTQPSGATSQVNFATQPRVATQDAGGNTLTSVNAGTATLSLKTPVTPAGAVLACTSLTATYVAGIATFAGCHIDLSGTYQLHAADLAGSGNSSALNITAAGATKLAFTTQPGSSTGGVAFTQPVVKVQDASGNTVTGDASSVTLTLTTPGAATLTCTANPKSVVAGIATFAGCKIDVANTYTLHAADGVLTPATSSALTIGVGAASKLGFSVQPSSSTGGVAFGTQPEVTVQDLGGNTVTGNTSSVTLSLTTPAGATLACTTNPKAAVAGVATFAGCNINLASGTPYTLNAADGALTAATSGPVTITAGVAAALAFTTQPSNSTGGVAFGTQPAVTVRDAGGNTVTGDTSNVTLTITTPAGATLACTTNPKAAVAGVATFAGCNINLASGTPYTLNAADGALTAATSGPITIGVGTATQLAFTQQPSSQTGGVAFATQPRVAIQDAGGNVVVADTTSVTLSLTTPAGATLTCTSNPQASVNGIATFAGCNIDLASGTPYTLHAVDGVLTDATSGPVTITVGPAARIAFVQQPSGGASLAPFGTQPQIATQDAGGNTRTTVNAGSVTLSLQTPVTPAGAVLSCTTSLTRAYVNGVASFTGCNIDLSGTYHLHADDGTFTANSNSVSITAAGSSQLAFSTQPSTTAAGGVAFASQPVVEIRDGVGNVVAGDTSSVTLTITTPNGATLSCDNNTQAAVAGVATFTGCDIDLASGTPYTLHAADAALTPATSGPITISAGPAAKLGFTVQPSNSTGGVAFGTQPSVAVQDAAGNTVAGDTSSVTLSLTTAAGATLTCTANPKAAVAGVAAFTGCNIDLASGTPYTLHAVDGVLTDATSGPITITAGAAAKLGFVQQPSDSTGGVAFATQPHVAIQDAGGNTVTGNTSSVTLTLTTAAGATLACTSANPLPAVAGVANFTGCNINLASGTPYTLHAVDGGLTDATSGPITITSGAAAALAFTTQPSNSTGGVAFGTQPAVTVRDAGGNTVTGDTSNVTLTITTPAGATLACTANPKAAVAGVATFAGCNIDLASGTPYTLRAADGALTIATSGPVTISVGAATKLAFTQQPTSQTGGVAFGTQPKVAIQDAGGNTVTSDTSSVNLTLTTANGATLTCTTSGNPLTAVAGVATFSGCKINRASATPYTLHAAVTGLTAATSTAITITIGPASQVVFTTQPSASTATNINFAAQPVASIMDAGGNVLINNNTSSITLDLTRPSTPVISVLSCNSNTVVVTAGVATFSGCSVDTASTPNYTLRANDTTDALVGTSSSFIIT